MQAKPLKSYIRKLYCEDNWDVAAIVESLNLQRNQSTIYNWCKKENWDALRQEVQKKNLKAPEVLMKTIEDTIIRLSNAKDDGEALRLADALSKFQTTYNSLYKNRDPFSNILFTLGDIGEFLKQYSKEKTLPEEFFSNLKVFLEAYKISSLKKYSKISG